MRQLINGKDDIMIFYKRKADANGEYGLKRNMITIYRLKLPCSKVPGDLRVKIVENAVINIGLVRLSRDNGPKLAVGQLNSS